MAGQVLNGQKSKRQRFSINGIVQGVGFRPFIHRIARQYGLSGFVSNNSNGVHIEVQGPPRALDKFTQHLRRDPPPLSRIKSIIIDELSPINEDDFHIDLTDDNAPASTFISPDVCVCDECLAELEDPSDRRSRYPFINCTNCGPRFTIISDIPYDRPLTSMRVFPMCPDCAREYHDPLDRRFHAQPNACPDCGPRLFAHGAEGVLFDCADPLEETVARLKKGAIVAICGLGGFHLAVDACNPQAILKLRQRKGRMTKPFALMVRDREVLKEICVVSQAEQTLLQSPARPIVLLSKKENCRFPDSLAPDNNYLGCMLPYTPLHFLLLKHFDALVMTSGNYSEEPIAIKNDEAFERLREIADFFLVHNREILHRCDDSIANVVAGKQRLIRRSRGYAPAPFFLNFKTPDSMLACGAELKNTVAVSRREEVFFSPHIGDLDNPKALAFFEESIAHLCGTLQIKPQRIVCDLHPEYLSAKWARQQGLPLIEVQHHHAHLAAVMAENHVMEPTIGLILDGTGYGTDGTIWGGEVLVGDFKGFERFAWLQPVALPGGASAIKEPWRMGLSYLLAVYGQDLSNIDLPFLDRIKKNDLNIVRQMIRKKINSPQTSGCGRLFDGVSAILGLCDRASFEAEAAVRLEMISEVQEDGFYPIIKYFKNRHGILPLKGFIQNIVSDFLNDVPVPQIAARFHNTLARLFCETALAAREKYQINRVGLSGGVYQNRYFFKKIQALLLQNDFELLTHAQVPANDGGLALGQIAIAAYK